MYFQRSQCINIHSTLFSLLKKYYEKCILVLDYRRLTLDLLEKQSITIENYYCTTKDFLFQTNSKLQRICKLSYRKYSNRIIRWVSSTNIILIKNTHYNKYYSFYSLIISNILQNNRIGYSYLVLLCYYDSIALSRSKITNIICELKIGNN